MWTRLRWAALACLFTVPGCADVTHVESSPPPAGPVATMVSTDGDAENFGSRDDVPAEWWSPRINANTPSVSWSGNTATGRVYAEARSNRGVVKGTMLVTNAAQTVAQDNQVLHTHTYPLPYTWFVGKSHNLAVHVACGQTADFKSSVSAANVVLVNWEVLTLGSTSSTAGVSATQMECPSLPGGEGGGGGGGGGSPNSDNGCVLWGVFVRGILTSTFWVC